MVALSPGSSVLDLDEARDLGTDTFFATDMVILDVYMTAPLGRLGTVKNVRKFCINHTLVNNTGNLLFTDIFE